MEDFKKFMAIIFFPFLVFILTILYVFILTILYVDARFTIGHLNDRIQECYSIDSSSIQDMLHSRDTIKMYKDTAKFWEEQYLVGRLESPTFNVYADDFYKDTTGQYFILFQYDTTQWETPMTYPAGCRHFPANVFIYRLTETKPKLLAFMSGHNYTKHLCYEDDLKGLVTEAKKKSKPQNEKKHEKR